MATEDLFAGRWTLVTGASSGLGEEFARQLAARRANLILTARSRDKLEALAGALAAEHGIETEVITGDIGAPGGAAALARAVDERGHEIEHLVANAGFGAHGLFVESEPERQAEMVRLNCEALVYLTARYLPGMVERGRGGVLLLSSIAAFQPTPYMATYGATKAFVQSLAEAISEEVRGRGVRVMALCPGPVPTGFQSVAGSDIAPSQRSAVLSADETVRRGLAAYQAGRRSYVPGFVNRVMLAGSHITPRGIQLRTVAAMMRGKARS